MTTAVTIEPPLKNRSRLPCWLAAKLRPTVHTQRNVSNIDQKTAIVLRNSSHCCSLGTLGTKTQIIITAPYKSSANCQALARMSKLNIAESVLLIRRAATVRQELFARLPKRPVLFRLQRHLQS